MNRLKDIFKGLFCGVLFSSAFYWTLVLSFVFAWVPFPVFLLMILASALSTNAVIGLLLTSDSYRHILYKG